MAKDVCLRTKKETLESLKEMLHELKERKSRSWWENYTMDILYSAIKHIGKKKKANK